MNPLISKKWLKGRIGNVMDDIASFFIVFFFMAITLTPVVFAGCYVWKIFKAWLDKDES